MKIAAVVPALPFRAEMDASSEQPREFALEIKFGFLNRQKGALGKRCAITLGIRAHGPCVLGGVDTGEPFVAIAGGTREFFHLSFLWNRGRVDN
jgi:hypothetical protein